MCSALSLCFVLLFLYVFTVLIGCFSWFVPSGFGFVGFVRVVVVVGLYLLDMGFGGVFDLAWVWAALVVFGFVGYGWLSIFCLV